MKVETKKEANPVKSIETRNKFVMYETDPLYCIIINLVNRIDSRGQESDDDTPPYTQMQRINSQINRAQSGEGPFHARFMDIAEIALAAMLSMKRRS